MGLIKAIGGAAAGGLADQWRDFFSCDSLGADTLVVRGSKQQGNRSSNTKGSDQVISNGSVVAVAPGQCALITEQGAIVEVCAEPGEYTWDTSSEPSLFYGDLGPALGASFKRFGRRIGFGGDTGRVQRIYFVNTKEVPGNRYGTTTPIPFRVRDAAIGLDMDVSLRCSGEYSYRIADPLCFFKNVAGNVEDSYGRGRIDSQLRAELLGALQVVLAQASARGLRYSELPGLSRELASMLADTLHDTWLDLRGIEIVSFGMNSVSPTEEDMERVKDLQATAVMRDAGMRTAGLASAQMDAVRAAAANESGAMTGFMGMLMANAAAQGTLGGIGATAFGAAGSSATGCAPLAGGGEGGSQGWTCACGARSEGRFCPECGAPAPTNGEAAQSWVCACGATNTGKFCTNCGSPAPAASWRCACGASNAGTSKFCGECGRARP